MGEKCSAERELDEKGSKEWSENLEETIYRAKEFNEKKGKKNFLNSFL